MHCSVTSVPSTLMLYTPDTLLDGTVHSICEYFFQHTLCSLYVVGLVGWYTTCGGGVVAFGTPRRTRAAAYCTNCDIAEYHVHNKFELLTCRGSEQHVWGLVGNITWFLLETYADFQRWQNFEKRSRFDEVSVIDWWDLVFMRHAVGLHDGSCRRG